MMELGLMMALGFAEVDVSDVPSSKEEGERVCFEFLYCCRGQEEAIKQVKNIGWTLELNERYTTQEWKAQTQRLYWYWVWRRDVFQTMLDVHNCNGPTTRRESLRRLRELVGKEAYQKGKEGILCQELNPSEK